MNTSKRKVFITECSTHRYFKEMISDVENRSIKCAYNLEEDCTPDCASCDINGCPEIASCVRNGLDDSFAIGMMD